VMIALSLTAITALGLVAVQSALARGERAAFLRERAVWMADSLVESVRGGVDGDAAASQWRARAAALLPDGSAAIADRADGVRVAVVSWRADDRAEPCPEPQARALSSCIVVAFGQ
jgi:Tfp pilus assembly protein PilV